MCLSRAHGLGWWNIQKGIFALTVRWKFRVGVVLSIRSLLIFDAWLNSIRLLTFFVLADAGSGKMSHLIEWVEKTSSSAWTSYSKSLPLRETITRYFPSEIYLRLSGNLSRTSSTSFLGYYRKSWYPRSTLFWRIFPSTKRLARRTWRLARSVLSSRRGNWGKLPVRKVVAHHIRLVIQLGIRKRRLLQKQSRLQPRLLNLRLLLLLQCPVDQSAPPRRLRVTLAHRGSTLTIRDSPF